MRSPAATLIVFALGSAFGCGGNGSSGPGPNEAQMSWMDDGTPVTPFGADATLTSANSQDSYRIDGLTEGPGSVTIILGAPTPIAVQTFDCNQLASGQSIVVSYANGTGFDINDQTCRVAITQVGKPGGPTLKGTFEAVITLASAGTKTLSNGAFNIPVRM